MLERLYAVVDARVAAAGPHCDASGRCCRFDEHDHTLFLTEMEADHLLAGGLPDNAVVRPGRCPFQVQGLCTARGRRPLGCRIYFCDPDYEPAMTALSEDALARLKEHHRRTDRPWNYRPLHHFLPAAAAEATPNPLSILRPAPACAVTPGAGVQG